jgi:hypothetical protein
MRRASLTILAALIAGPAAANTVACGKNAFTYAEVVEVRPHARGQGPVISVPDSLCADLIEGRKPAIGSFSLQIGDPYGRDLVGRGGERPARR